MTITWTQLQNRRLKELNACDPEVTALFGSTADRDRVYQNLEKELVKMECQK